MAALLTFAVSFASGLLGGAVLHALWTRALPPMEIQPGESTCDHCSSSVGPFVFVGARAPQPGMRMCSDCVGIAQDILDTRIAEDEDVAEQVARVETMGDRR